MPNFLNRIDWILFLPAVLSSLIGILMIYSASVGTDKVDYSFVNRQVLYLIFGVVVYVIVTNINYRLISNLSLVFYVLTILLLILTFFIGHVTRGSTRWIDIGFITVQPSEIAKPVIILVLSWFFSKYPPTYLKNILISLVLTAVPAFLVFLQPDLGNTLIIIALWAVLVFSAGIRFFAAAIFIASAFLAAPLIWHFLKTYQRDRLISFLSPEEDPLGTGYNLVQSIIAVGSGGLFGRGFGRGTQSHLNFLPEQKTDFIFATTAEELGFLGVSLLVGLLLVIIYRVIKTVVVSQDPVGSLICIGVSTMLVIHVFINIGMNIGLFPVTGITLPLVSFGGSSLISIMVCLGLVNSVSIGEKKSARDTLRTS